MTETEQVVFSGGTKRAHRCPDYAEIPTTFLTVLAQRFELGAETYGRDNWRKSLCDTSFLRDVFNHAFAHMLHLRDSSAFRVEDNDDDIAAIAWAMAVLAEARAVKNGEQE